MKQNPKWRIKMPKRFCVNTKGLTADERKAFAIELDKFVSKRKTQIQKNRDSNSGDKE